jgi:hypothetical protein
MLEEMISWHILLGGGITLIGIALSQIKVLPFMIDKRL